MIDETIEEVRSRRNYYRDNYRRFSRALMVSLIIILFLFFTIVYLAATRGQPAYYASSSSGLLQQIGPAPVGTHLPAPAEDQLVNTQPAPTT